MTRLDDVPQNTVVYASPTVFGRDRGKGLFIRQDPLCSIVKTSTYFVPVSRFADVYLVEMERDDVISLVWGDMPAISGRDMFDLKTEWHMLRMGERYRQSYRSD